MDRNSSLNALRSVMLLSVLSFAFESAASADDVHVRFDLPPTVACYDRTDAAFAAAHPGERLLEAKIEISSLLVSGEEDDLVEYLFRMTSPQHSLRIVDYSPRTTLASDYNGGIAVEEREEKTNGAGLAITGAIEPIKITGHGDAGTKKTLIRKYELAAPMDSVASSGTIEQGFGVYFKLRQSRQENLEGAREFTIVFRVAESWRGDLLEVRCEAFTIERGIVRQFDEQVHCGLEEVSVAMYRVGDLKAKSIAERYAVSTRKLRAIAVASHQEIKRRSYPSFFHELGGLLDVTDPKIPSSWLQQILTANVSGHSFENRLPDRVRSAASEYLTAKRDLRQLKR